MEQIKVDRKVIMDLAKRLADINDRIESLILASDPKFMESLKKSKDQIKKREFANWDEL
jgi:hypothetical protein